jgi:hypothetical protein
MRQIHRHVHRRHGVLNAFLTIANGQGKSHILDPNAVNGKTTVVSLVLSVGQCGHEKGWKGE